MSTLASFADDRDTHRDTVVSVVVVTHNSADCIESCLESVVASEIDAGLDVIVVDNRSDDDTIARIDRRFVGVRILVPETRGGFARNVNIGLRAATGDPILILNPDTGLEPSTVELVARHLERHPAAGGLDERYPLFVEDTDWCRRARDAGWQIAYVPAARIAGDGTPRTLPTRSERRRRPGGYLRLLGRVLRGRLLRPEVVG
jgi:GT2 family glycosyltransferase